MILYDTFKLYKLSKKFIRSKLLFLNISLNFYQFCSKINHLGLYGAKIIKNCSKLASPFSPSLLPSSPCYFAGPTQLSHEHFFCRKLIIMLRQFCDSGHANCPSILQDIFCIKYVDSNGWFFF